MSEIKVSATTNLNDCLSPHSYSPSSLGVLDIMY